MSQLPVRQTGPRGHACGSDTELGELEAVGSEPNSHDNTYPADIEAAQQRLADLYSSDWLPQHTAAAVTFPANSD
ncbi:hypothetical protein M3I53_34485 [Paraburkholderia sp. CNPSo 3272]|uniref:hypothetical protein n=1 Tax=Paraburkholderia sp. CNPSo 3272 TaxID=2940931 RepID=UPI0020B7ADE0|nr:hypothetical protein [Paraburkholderia sp. CNPSo 3272]MCP3728159.1 hypothetical protein [Paraburkholderia sp. CNPSo 3272]